MQRKIVEQQKRGKYLSASSYFRQIMTCYMGGYCCRHINITGQSTHSNYRDGGDLPIETIKELADANVPLAGSCVDNLIRSSETVMFFHHWIDGEVQRVRIEGDFYKCGLYEQTNRPSFCSNEKLIVPFSDMELEKRLTSGKDLPRCVVAEKFGIKALKRLPDIYDVQIL